jgi:hypothetical protein
VGVKVIEDWSSGDKAADNIINHAKWLDAAAAWAERLSVAAEAVAHAFDIAKQDTPCPDAFADAESDVMAAAALMAASPAIGMIEYQQATSRYADLVAKAEEAAKQYHASVSAALTGVGNPIVPCPPIGSQADIPKVGPPPKPDPELEFNTRSERLDHTFAAKHNLDGVVERAGGRVEAMRQILDGLKGHVPRQGRFETVINVSSQNVTVRGFVDSDGMIKIGTAFIP